jgi:hypothetical protein
VTPVQRGGKKIEKDRRRRRKSLNHQRNLNHLQKANKTKKKKLLKSLHWIIARNVESFLIWTSVQRLETKRRTKAMLIKIIIIARMLSFALHHQQKNK